MTRAPHPVTNLLLPSRFPPQFDYEDRPARTVEEAADRIAAELDSIGARFRDSYRQGRSGPDSDMRLYAEAKSYLALVRVFKSIVGDRGREVARFVDPSVGEVQEFIAHIEQRYDLGPN